MKPDPRPREILHQFQELINVRRCDTGQRKLTTAQVMDEICEYMTCQCAMYIGGQGRKRQINMMTGGYAACHSARKNLQATACGERTGDALRAAPSFSLLPILAYTSDRFHFLSGKPCPESVLLRNQMKNKRGWQ